MSSEQGNEGVAEGGQPSHREQPGADPMGTFDAFRARQAEEREQQETQTVFTFPAEYAVDPNAPFPPAEPAPQPFAAPYGAQHPYGARRGGRFGAGSKSRSVAVLGGAVVLVCALLGFGAWAAFGSSAPASSTGAGSAATGAAATGGSAGKHTKALSFRVAIHSVGADSFTGTVPATGETVTIALTDQTHYGTKAHPFSQSDLTPGETVLVHGRRTGAATVTATIVAAETGASPSASATAAIATTAA